MKQKPFICSRCGRRSSSRDGVQMHIDAKHKGVGDVEKVKRKEYEPSYAEMLIDGIIDGEWTEDGEYIG